MNTPGSMAELVESVRASPRVDVVGAGTKSRLPAEGAAGICTRQLRGILEYDPSEFTFTALAERGQYMPFDPMFAGGGATLGGTIAAGLSGPGRFRYGGLRDFILGVR